jgi:twinkle protein
MARVLADDIDYAAYERQTECRAKVRRASVFTDELHARFQPPEKQPRHPEMFSTKLRGGLRFRPGEVTCWTGYSKHRKSMFTGQVALDLCVQRERVLMASFEMYPADTLTRMAKQASGIQPPTTGWLDRFAKWTDSRLWLFDHVGRINPQQCMAVARYFAEECKGTQLFVDSMMMVVGSEESADEQKQFATDIIRVAQETGLHIHLITHCRKPQGGDESKPPTKYDVRGSAAITDQAHNIVTVWANKAKRAKLERNAFDAEAAQEPDALVSVEGQRNGAFEGRVKLWFHDESMRFLDEQFGNCEPYPLLGAA